jgi:hypothetical protein
MNMEVTTIELQKIEELVQAQVQLQADELASLQLAIPCGGFAEVTFY